MNINERKKVGVGVSLIAIFGAIATVVGFYSDIKDIFTKDDNDSNQESLITTTTVSQEVQETVDATEENATEETTEPPVTESSVVYLADLEPVEDDDNFFVTDTAKDTNGNIYTGKLNYFWYRYNNSTSDKHVTFYLGGKYTKLSGTIAISNETGNDQTTTLCILGDDTSIYATDEIGKISTPIEFSIDVTGVQWLKLNKTGWAEIILSDWKFE